MPEDAALEQIEELRARLAEAEETIRAIHSGEIDAVIVQGETGEQVYTLRSAEQPYRTLVEQMGEGALILTTDGDIAYSNRRFAELVATPQEEAIGGSVNRFISESDRGGICRRARARGLLFTDDDRFRRRGAAEPDCDGRERACSRPNRPRSCGAGEPLKKRVHGHTIHVPAP